MTPKTPAEHALDEPVGFGRHDHKVCVETALSEADARCKTAGLRFTPARRRVLEILLEEHRALGAYDVLQRMQAEGLGAQPPAAYRALDFLVSNGFAHRVERLNAYIACMHSGTSHVPAFLHCRVCGGVAEAVAAPEGSLLGDIARESGFSIETSVVEASGICASCLEIEPAARTDTGGRAKSADYGRQAAGRR